MRTYPLRLPKNGRLEGLFIVMIELRLSYEWWFAAQSYDFCVAKSCGINLYERGLRASPTKQLTKTGKYATILDKNTLENEIMFLKLRIIFTVLAAVCLALVLPMGTYGGLVWAIITAAAAGVFFLLMLLFKQEQEKRENPPTTEPDFFHPQNKNEDEKDGNNEKN